MIDSFLFVLFSFFGCFIAKGFSFLESREECTPHCTLQRQKKDLNNTDTETPKHDVCLILIINHFFPSIHAFLLTTTLDKDVKRTSAKHWGTGTNTQPCSFLAATNNAGRSNGKEGPRIDLVWTDCSRKTSDELHWTTGRTYPGDRQLGDTSKAL